MTKLFLLQAEHFSVPGRISKAFATLAGAEDEAISITNGMLVANGQAQSAHASNWRAKVENLQGEHGAQFCYVEIDEMELHCPAPTGPYHGSALADQLRLIASLAGTTDKRGHQDQRDAMTYVERVTGMLLAALAEAEWLIDNAITTHIYGDDDEVDPDCSYTAGLAQVKAAIAAAGGANRIPPVLDALTRIVGERIFGDGTDACEQRVIDLCVEAQKAHGITRESWAQVLAGAPAKQGGTPVIPVDALEWQEIGEEHQPKARLLAALQIGDCMFHVEAREIDPEADPQSTLEYGDDLAKFGDIADQADFATMTREGREYFVFMLPYEA